MPTIAQQGTRYPTYTSLSQSTTELTSVQTAATQTNTPSLPNLATAYPTISTISRTSTYIKTSDSLISDSVSQPTQSWYFS